MPRGSRYSASGLRRNASVVSVVLLSLLLAGEEKTVAIFATTDTHGHIYPFYYATGTPRQYGLAKVSTIIKRLRKRYPNNIFIDAGDALQGSEILDYYHTYKPEEPSPIVVAMNLMRYDAIAVGNHDFDYGLETLMKAVKDSAFPWLSCNVVRESTGEPVFKPFVVIVRAGCPFRLIGATTPNVTRWVEPDYYRGLAFRNEVESVRRVLRKRTRNFINIVICHTEAGKRGYRLHPRGPWDIGYYNVAQLRGIDLLICGHTHREVAGERVGGTLLVQPKFWAQSVAVVELKVARRDENWRVTRKRSWIEPVEGAPPDEEILRALSTQHKRTLKYLHQVVAISAQEADSSDALVRDNAVIDLIHKVQLFYTKADVSFASVFSTEASIPQGEVRVSQIYRLYPYENLLYAVSMKGSQIKQYLEQCASFFRRYRKGRRVLDPEKPFYRYDTAEGVEYVINLSNPEGERIIRLDFRGKPIERDRVFRVALNNFRALGGGGYIPNIGGVKILWRSKKKIRHLIIDYLRFRRVFRASATGNWNLIPQSAVGQILEELRLIRELRQ